MKENITIKASDIMKAGFAFTVGMKAADLLFQFINKAIRHNSRTKDWYF